MNPPPQSRRGETVKSDSVQRFELLALEPTMESLIQLVAESFARHGIDSLPVSDYKPAETGPRPALPEGPEILPLHDFRKALVEDPAP